MIMKMTHHRQAPSPYVKEEHADPVRFFIFYFLSPLFFLVFEFTLPLIEVTPGSLNASIWIHTYFSFLFSFSVGLSDAASNGFPSLSLK
ncbi:hypothetical protein F4809DRAFT_634172 [Biscogniauxia mediterranea]|nr:hypothetical protein F4809DRAFT_634172 [Biscogniauxia mediterranea]